MVKRKLELHAVPDFAGMVLEPPAQKLWCAPLESEALLEHAARLFPDSDYLPIAWIAAVAYLRTVSKCGWRLDGPKS